MAQTPAVSEMRPNVVYVPVQMSEPKKSACEKEPAIEQVESSFFDSVAKAAFFTASLYGAYRLGVRVAADKAGQAFEQFLSQFRPMDPRGLPTGSETNLEKMGSWVWKGATDLSQYAKEGGVALREYVIGNTGGLDVIKNLNHTITVVTPHMQRTWNVTQDVVASATGSARDIASSAASGIADTTIKSFAAFGVGTGGAYWGLNALSSMPSKLVKVAVELYKYSPLPGAHKLRQVN